MNYITFKEHFSQYPCFNINQILTWFPHFDKNNLTRWINKGLLIRLRRGIYSFPGTNITADLIYYYANKIYVPSYISLHSALAFYGLIPEAVVHTTSVTTLKTKEFNNKQGKFIYKSVKKELFFGYELKEFKNNMVIKFATKEKALLDLLYLYPFYKSEKDFIDLRLNYEIMQDEFDWDLFSQYTNRINSGTLSKKAALVRKIFLES